MSFLVNKHPDAEPWFIVEWSDYVESIGEPSIDSSEWDEVSTSGLTINGTTIDGLTTKARVSGGVDGSTYYLENKVTFSDLSVDVVSFTVVVADGVPD